MICLGVVIAVVKIAQQLELQIVRVAFDHLQSCIHLARGRDIGAFAQCFHHREHGFRGLIEQFDLFETAAVDVLRKNHNALADFLDRLGNLIERRGQRLDILAFQRRDECLAELFRQLLRDLFIFAPAVDKCVQTLRRIVLLQFVQKGDEMMHAAVRLLRAALRANRKIFRRAREIFRSKT